jgi:TPR repeat protein
MKLNQHDKAMAWFRQAADLHSSPGNFNIGKAYQLGTGVPKDPYTAFDWLIKAAKQKNQDAYVEIGNMFGSGIGVPVNKYLSLEWLCKSQRQDLINMAQSQIVDLKYVDKSTLRVMKL